MYLMFNRKLNHVSVPLGWVIASKICWSAGRSGGGIAGHDTDYESVNSYSRIIQRFGPAATLPSLRFQSSDYG